MCGSTCFAHSQAAFRSVAKNRSHSCSVIVVASYVALTPALLTSSAGGPKWAVQAYTSASTSSSTPTSAADELRARERLAGRRVAAAAEHHGKPVGRQSLDRRPADAAYPARHDRHPRDRITVSMIDVDVITASRDALGECPVWLPHDRLLQRVDITGRAIVRLDVTTGAEQRCATGADVGFALPAPDGGIVAGIERELVRLASPGGPMRADRRRRTGSSAEPLQRRRVRPGRPAVGGDHVAFARGTDRGAVPRGSARARSSSPSPARRSPTASTGTWTTRSSTTSTAPRRRSTPSRSTSIAAGSAPGAGSRRSIRRTGSRTA